MSSNKFNIILDKFKKNKTLQGIAFAILIIAIILICFTNVFSSESNNEVQLNKEEYVFALETRLSEVLSQVEGAGKVSVVLTVESGMENVLAMKVTKNETSNGVEITETPILVNGKTVVLKENYPKIVGVLIVAEGAKNISVLSKIQQATMSLLDIKANQIEILTMK